MMQQILERRATLPRELNGRNKAPSDPLAAQIRKHMAEGRDGGIRRWLTVDVCDLRDGVLLETVLSPHYEAIAFLELQADKLPVTPRDLAVLNRAEQRAGGRCDLTQFKVQESPNDPVVLRDAIRACDEQMHATAALRRQLHARLMIVAGTTQCPMAVAQ
jgi:hypothetical protein